MRGALAGLLIGLAACRPAAEPTIAFVQANVIPMTGDTVLLDQTVLIQGDRIVRMGAADLVEVPGDARVVQAEGAYLIPGLWDMHVHALANADVFFPLLLSHGVVGIRDMGSRLEDVERIRSRATQNVTAPGLAVSGPLLDGARTPWSHDIAWHLDSPQDALDAVEALVEAGVDFLKIYSTLAPEVYHSLARDARERGIPFAGHVPFSVSAGEASDAGQASLEHGGLDITTSDCVEHGNRRFRTLLGVWGTEGYGPYLDGQAELRQARDPACTDALFRRFRDNGTWIVPTIVNEIKDGATVDWSAVGLMDEEAQASCRRTVELFEEAAEDVRRRHHRAFLEDVGALHRAGVPILAGTDAPNPCVVPGASLHRELAWLVEAGLSPYEALQAATVHPARFLGAADHFGTLAEGMAADLVLLEGNPLEDIQNTRTVRLVMVGGRILPRPTPPARWR